MRSRQTVAGACETTLHLVYDECMKRLMTTDGLMLCTFTPLDGMTEIVRRFLPQLAA